MKLDDDDPVFPVIFDVAIAESLSQIDYGNDCAAQIDHALDIFLRVRDRGDVMGFGAFNTKKITGVDTIDFIKNRQLIAKGALVNEAFMEEVLGKPQAK